MPDPTLSDIDFKNKMACVWSTHNFWRDLWNHLKLHHDEPKYICDICKHKCFTKANLNNHMQKHKGEEHRCDKCDFVTHTAKFLNNHKLNKHIEKSFKCDFCDYKTSTKEQLMDHIRHNHTMERPFKCDQCDKAFSSSIKLIRHKVWFSVIWAEKLIFHLMLWLIAISL